MLNTRNGETPDIPVKPFARARGNYLDDDGGEHVDDWRPPELPYSLGPEHRLPLEYNQGSHSPDGPRPTEDTCRAIERLVINGASVHAAKSLVGITKMRWAEWRKHAAAGKEPFAAFMRRMDMVRSHVEATCTTVIRSAAVHPDPKVAVPAAVRVLEQQFPARYAPQTRNKLEVHHSGAVQVRQVNALDGLSAEDVAKLLSGAAPMLADVQLTARNLLTAPADVVDAEVVEDDEP